MFQLPPYSEKSHTKDGVDILMLGLEFLKLINSETNAKEINNFFDWLESELKRPLEEIEKLNFYNVLLDYVNSESGSNEREKVMVCIFNTDFLISETNSK